MTVANQAVSPVDARSRSTYRRFVERPQVLVGVVLVAVVLTTAFLGPFVAPQKSTDFVAPPFGHSADTSFFGADYLGRDVLSRYLTGGRTLLVAALMSTLLGVGAGVFVGVVAAMLRGVRGELIMRALDVLMAFPAVVLVLMCVTLLGSDIWLLVLLVALLHMPQTARVIRSLALDIVGRDYVRAAEIIGTPRRTILLREIAPNIAGLVLVELGLRFTLSIAILSAINFLGFGARPPASDWGLMISENQIGLSVAPWGVLLPVLTIAVLTIGTNFIADGLGQTVTDTEQAGS